MLTVGNLLKKAREHAGKKIEEAAQITKIKPDYLEKIERNDFSGFNSSAFVKGFIRSYASYLGLDAENIVALFRRQIGEEDVPLKAKNSPIKTESTIISPAMIMSGALIVFFIGLFGYLFFQFYKLQQAPSFTISSPQESAVTVDKPTLEIKGFTEANTIVTVNDKQVQLKDDNTFSILLDLKEGANTFKFVVWKKNIESRKTEKLITATYAPQGGVQVTQSTQNGVQQSTVPTAPQGKEATIKLDVSGEAWIQVVVDSTQKAVGIKEDFSQTYTATKMYEITTGKPNATKATINGEQKSWNIRNGVGSIVCNYQDATREWNCR